MEIPSFFLIGSYKIYTFGLFLLLGFFLALFVIWQEGRKDGFDEEKLFDLFLVSLVSGVICARFLFALFNRFILYALFLHVVRFWTEGLSASGAVLGFVLVIIFFVRRWKWSAYRVLDIFSLALAFGMTVPFLGLVALQKDFSFLFVFAFCALVYALLSWLRVSKLKSGFVFSIFLLLSAIASAIVFGRSIELLFYIVLCTMSLVNLILRGRLLMAGSQLPKNLFANLRKILLSSLKRLKKEQKILNEEDPYMQEGRSVGNSEEMDEALLEDAQKEVIDLKKASNEEMLADVNRALGRMETGAYGVCEECGGSIEAGRLKAYPAASTCATCSEKEAKEINA